MGKTSRTLAALAMAVLTCAQLPADGRAKRATPTSAPASTLVYIGTHGGTGPNEGIFAARLDLRTGVLTDLGLAANIVRPTWQVSDPRRAILYSVSETGNDGKSQGGVYSFAIDRRTGKLRQLGRSDSGGGGATHLAYDSRSQTVFVANFGGGQVSAIPVDARGAVMSVRSLQTDIGSGPHRRQTGPHAHGVTIDPTGRFVLVPDLGADKVFVYPFNRQSKMLSPAAPSSMTVPAGSGPRHLVFSPDGRFAFLDTELTGEVFVYRWNARVGELTLASRTAINPPEFTGEKSAAEILVSRDGRFLYVSERGANTLVAYAIDQGSGALTEVQRVPAGGTTPWSFGIDPSGRWLLSANEGSSALTVFAVDPATGQLMKTANTLTVPKPVSIAFSR